MTKTRQLLQEMTFTRAGRRVRHPEHGRGTVTRMLGRNSDDGMSIKLDTGRRKRVRFNGDNENPGGWKGFSRGVRIKENESKHFVLIDTTNNKVIEGPFHYASDAWDARNNFDKESKATLTVAIKDGDSYARVNRYGDVYGEPR